jgi:choline dehydrogenase-like flavoprotein
MNRTKRRVCVVGSGAGGAVVAHGLAERGYDVTIVESGSYVAPKEMNEDELHMMGRLYKDGGLQLSADFDFNVIQGHCVGGSTVINDAICFRMPSDILTAWQELGVQIDQGSLDKSYDTVEKRLRVTPVDPYIASPAGRLFLNGCNELSLAGEWFHHNRVDCLGTGGCNLGCPYSRKQSMNITYIPWAQELNARLVSDCHALRVETERGRAIGVTARRPDGSRCFIAADHVVISCGAIGSSGLLLRSGIRENVGSRLSFNAGSLMHGFFDDPVNAYAGISMCAFLRGEGFLLELLFGPPGVYALTMPGWFEEHGANMQHYSHLVRVGTLIGTKPNGRVRLDWLGNEVIDYEMASSDFERLKKGLKLAARVLFAAGARRVMATSFDTIAFDSVDDLDWLDTAIEYREDLAMGSAHPQGGNPMSDDPSIGVVDSDFRVHGTDNLYIVDASVHPASVHVNPQLTIMAMADYAAGRIANRAA